MSGASYVLTHHKFLGEFDKNDVKHQQVLFLEERQIKIRFICHFHSCVVKHAFNMTLSCKVMFVMAGLTGG